ncbi:MAG: HNH endonuclease [Streptosporangiales bacterium]|nr:HNH endonuclease [Streptosporangiales bacterium]
MWLVADEPEHLQFAVAVDMAQRLVAPGDTLDTDRRQYVQRLTRLRLHQQVFRARVLQAYARTCAMCRLRVVDLVDAAHILPDGHPRGAPVVPNGLALCKIHHAAFDRHILGIRPDFVIQVRRDILRETDGPMLRHGLQEMVGVRVLLPSSPRAHPDRERLRERYEMFCRASPPPDEASRPA